MSSSREGFSTEGILREHKEVLAIFAELERQHALVRLESDEGRGLQCELVEVNPARGLLVVSGSADGATNRDLERAAPLTASTLTGLPVRWRAGDVRVVSSARRPLLALPIPRALERIQRRRNFRLTLPLKERPLLCRLPLLEGPLVAAPFDLSLGGLGLTLRGVLPRGIAAGAVLEGCRLECELLGTLTMALKVCRVQTSFREATHSEWHRLGLEFVGLCREASNAILRYLVALARSRLRVS